MRTQHINSKETDVFEPFDRNLIPIEQESGEKAPSFAAKSSHVYQKRTDVFLKISHVFSSSPQEQDSKLRFRFSHKGKSEETSPIETLFHYYFVENHPLLKKLHSSHTTTKQQTIPNTEQPRKNKFISSLMSTAAAAMQNIHNHSRKVKPIICLVHVKSVILYRSLAALHPEDATMPSHYLNNTIITSVQQVCVFTSPTFRTQLRLACPPIISKYEKTPHMCLGTLRSTRFCTRPTA